ncbi:hypothetical protein [Streptomyces uncialis]|uniref:hypothetical protein n=1 Tax=Streptomyces uncialis TaxID=1048205 RepID=UPI00386E5EF1|nr:hypothetical protein OG924_28555 [Streptomyces uncialis]
MICSHCDQPIQNHEAYERQSSPSASGPGTTLYRHAVPCDERRPAPRRAIVVCPACLTARISGRAEDTHACHGVTWMRVEGRLLTMGAVADRCPCPCPSGTGRHGITQDNSPTPRG